MKVWDADNGPGTLSLSRGTQAGSCERAFSPDGKRIVTGSGDKTVKVWDAEQGPGILTLKGHTDSVTQRGVQPDGKRIVTGAR